METWESEEEEGSDEVEGDEEEGSDFEEEKAGDSEETEVACEEHTDMVDDGDEHEGEKVEQNVDGEEHDILVLDDETTEDERTSRRNTRMSRRIEEILAAKRYRGEEKDTSKAEKEIPLIRRPRNTRVVVDEEAPTEEAEGEVPVHTEVGDETEAEDKAAVEERARADRKRKGKQIAQPKKKKARQTSSNVVIQEPSQDPIQVPYKSTEGEESDGETEREAEEVARIRREDIASYYEKMFVKVDRQL